MFSETTVPKSASNPLIYDTVCKFDPKPPNVSERLVASKIQASAASALKEPSHEPVATSKNSSPEAAAASASAKKKPFLCEALLRGKCDADNKCEYFHVKKPIGSELLPDVDISFLWQYRVPPDVLSSQTGLEYILKLEDASLTNDGWLSFEWTDAMALENAFIDPSQSNFILQGAISDAYPFTGRFDVRFENFSPVDSSFKLVTRLKVKDSTNTASSSQTTKTVDLLVRCLRPPSHIEMKPTCTKATKWCWWLDDDNDYFELPSNTQWIDSSHLFGDHVLGVEEAYMEKKQHHSFKAKLPNKTGLLQSFTFNFESMTLIDEDGGGKCFKLRRRPARL